MADAGDLRQFDALARAAHEFARAAERLSDSALHGQTEALRRRLADGGQPLDLWPEALASAREAARRVVGTPLTDAQLAGGTAVQAGRVVQMTAGEGQTLAALLAAYLHALAGHGVHVATIDDRAARRGAALGAAVLGALGLQVGMIDSGSSKAERARAYAADVTYAPYGQFGYDYLRDNLAWQPDETVQRGQHAAVLDGIDAILIGRAGEVLVMNGRAEPDVGRYRKLARLAAQFRSGAHYAIDQATGTVTLTEAGAAQAEAALGVAGLLRPENLGLAGSVTDAIRAREWFRRDRDYVVADDQVAVVTDPRASRLGGTTRFGRGIRQAIEASEGLHISAEEDFLARISVPGYFRLYDSVAGLAATAMDAAAELRLSFGPGVAPPACEEVGDDQCAQTYQMRRAILEAGDLRAYARTMIGDAVQASVAAHPLRLRDALAALYPVSLTSAELATVRDGPAAAARVTARATADALAAYQRREQELGPATLRELERKLMLGVIDREWREHLSDTDRLRESVTATGPGDGGPLDGYRRAAAERYGGFLRRVSQQTVSHLFFLELPP